MPHPPPTTSRRAALAAVLAAPLGLAACELEPPASNDTDSEAGNEAEAPQRPPDAEVVAMARKAILLRVATIERAVSAHPRLSAEFDPWLQLHAAHLAVLNDDSEDYDVDGALPAQKLTVVRAGLLSDEGALAGTLADTARQAASGDLARALASMSAAVTQRLVA